MQCVTEREGTIYYRNKQIDVSFSCVYPVIDDEFRHNIVKVVCGFTGLSSHGSMTNNRKNAGKTDVNLLIHLRLFMALTKNMT